ncbi:hypothetical protein BH23PLA1_BH23PLA1_39310 [soil metagenome]
MFWLQSADKSALAFLLIDPFMFFADYTVELSAADRRELQVEDRSDVAVLAIATLPRRQGAPCTVNLQGPVALNLASRLARQIVISDPELGTRRPIDLTTARHG